MKYFRLFLSVFFAWIAFASPVFAETIQSFDVKAELTYDRELTITETIVYDFETELRHGIYRFIPNVYDRNGAKYRLGIKFLDATMDGKPATWNVSGSGALTQIKIGDADRYVSGRHVYVFIYRTNRAINDFSDHRELYWNVTGNEWGIPVQNITFALTGPAEANRVACFTGIFGSTLQDCTIRTSEKNVLASSNGPFTPGEGMTVVIGYPLDALRAKTAWDNVLDFLQDNLWAFTPIIVFFVMLYLWNRYGKEPKGRGTVIPHYEEPNNLPPGYMAALLEQNVSQRAFTATILDLARRGHLKIRIEGDKKFTFIKGTAPENVAPYELTIWKGLFKLKDEATLEDLKGKFWVDISHARTETFAGLQEKKLFGRNPTMVRGLWIGVAALAFLSVFWLVPIFGEAFVLSGVISAIIVAVFGWQMPQMTQEGAIKVEEIKGFKWFLSVTEKARLDFTDAPERKPEQFARFLPAAVAFGVEAKWAGQFAGIDIKPPTYFQGSTVGWNAMQFVGAVDNLHASSVSSMYAAPSSAGGGGSGFSGGGSGGGFGGGGGGSW